MNPVWELSTAHESYYLERKTHVATLLEQWGSTTNNRWPDQARFISIVEVTMTPAYFAQIVELGRSGITKVINGWKLAELFPQRTWREHAHHVYFTESRMGNANNGRAPGLFGWIVGDDYVRIVSLGCNHPNAEIIKVAGQLTRHICPDCKYRWEIDTSD